MTVYKPDDGIKSNDIYIFGGITGETSTWRQLKGIVHLNIIFSFTKFNKICNLDHPVY